MIMNPLKAVPLRLPRVPRSAQPRPRAHDLAGGDGDGARVVEGGRRGGRGPVAQDGLRDADLRHPREPHRGEVAARQGV